MSPASTEHHEVQPPDTHEPNADANHDQGNDRSIEDRRGFFQKNPLAKPIVILVVIVAVLAVGWFWWDSRHWENTDDAEIDGHIYPISARVGGQVIKVTVDDGQFVHQGDVLVVTDPTDYKVALDRAQADYQDSQAPLTLRALACRFPVLVRFRKFVQHLPTCPTHSPASRPHRSR